MFLSCDEQQYHQSHPSNELHESTATAGDDCHTVVHTFDHSRTDSPKQANQVLCEHSSHCHNSCQSQSGGSGSSPSLYHGEPLTDRRSTFQAHSSPMHSVAEASSLKSNKKISTATHNISAYRISGGPHNTCLQDCDDDGESQTGSRLLHLLYILEAKDVLVVVSRWFSGFQLGPDRFKHINNVARDLLMRCGYIDDLNDSNHSNQSNKHKKKVLVCKCLETISLTESYTNFFQLFNAFGTYKRDSITSEDNLSEHRIKSIPDLDSKLWEILDHALLKIRTALTRLIRLYTQTFPVDFDISGNVSDTIRLRKTFLRRWTLICYLGVCCQLQPEWLNTYEEFRVKSTEFQHKTNLLLNRSK